MIPRQPISPRGVAAAFATPIFLGMSPVFGKLAIEAGADSFTVAALRTLVAIALLWLVYSLFFRRYIYIYPAGLLGCIVIGAINGIGSLFYYGGLTMLDTSLVQLINGSYLAFAVLLSRLIGQKASLRTLIRVGLAMLALVMITGFNDTALNWTGVGLMLGNALMFAGTVILSQFVLYEMPAPTATLYILTTMGVVVSMIWLAVSPPLAAATLEVALLPILCLALTTALSRLAMFAGVKFLGGMQTAILGITEIGISLLLAALFLGDALSTGQWAGVALLMVSILLIRPQDMLPHGINPGALIVANMASVQFQRIAFHRAFGTREHDNAEGTMANITTQEMIAIQRMMGAQPGGIDPFPISKTRLFPNEAQERLLESQPITLPEALREALRRRKEEDDDSRI
ncbi:MAG: DMT family transporter [Anaerolineae bacterium]|jgi:drug/metabolite transporter (DMT)-like permease|nr:DMT family transporter [Anaerolineae bacterium]